MLRARVRVVFTNSTLFNTLLLPALLHVVPDKHAVAGVSDDSVGVTGDRSRCGLESGDGGLLFICSYRAVLVLMNEGFISYSKIISKRNSQI